MTTKSTIINNIVTNLGFAFVNCTADDFEHIYINFVNFKTDLQQAKNLGDLSQIGIFTNCNNKLSYYLA